LFRDKERLANRLHLGLPALNPPPSSVAEKIMQRYLAISTLLTLSAAVAHADNWPAWRGPTGQGFCFEKNLPVKWSAKENVKWKIQLADAGNSTPVIWGDKIFLTKANKGGSVRSLLCLARADGKQLWQKDVEYPGKEINWGGITYTNASAAVDDQRVVACFASAGLYCYDHDGKLLWKRTDLGSWQHSFGSGASPVLYEDLVIQWCGPNSIPEPDPKEGAKTDKKDPKTDKGAKDKKGPRNFLVAVDKNTGKTAWEHDEQFGSWSTPLIINHNGQDQLLLGLGPDAKNKPDPETNYFKGLDPKTGKELWHCRGLNSYVYTSPLFANGVAVQMCGFGGSALAVKLGGKEDITKDRLWLHPQNIQRVGSGMIVGEHVYMIDESGVAHCYELTTGKDLWKKVERPAGDTWGSMVHADGKLYVLMRSGDTVVLKADPKFEILAVNSLGAGEQTNSSVAISNGEIYLRTFRSLWCISEKK
jgi:outer membrane protein assembly factor BamB